MAIRRTDLRTTDRDLAVAAIKQLVPHEPDISFDDPAKVNFRVQSAQLGPFGADLVRAAGVEYAAEVPPMGDLLAACLVHGHGLVEQPGGDLAVAGEDAFLYVPDHAHRARFHDVAMLLLRVPMAYTAQLAEEHTGLAAAELRFTALSPVSDAMRAGWAETAAFICRHMSAQSAAVPPLVAEQLLRLAAATILATFPNTAMTAAEQPGEGRTTPAVIRRATSFIDSHCERPLTVTEIAAVVGVGPRALQGAFRRHLDTTPLTYLRRVRLERAHEQLRAANPGAGVTVADVARRWGFTHPGRFSGEYRAAFGQAPSRVLRKDVS
jgi:AraC-like DNA-binding protein